MNPPAPSPTSEASDAIRFLLDYEGYDFRLSLPVHVTARRAEEAFARAERMGFEVLSANECLPEYQDDGTVHIYLVPREESEQWQAVQSPSPSA